MNRWSNYAFRFLTVTMVTSLAYADALHSAKEIETKKIHFDASKSYLSVDSKAILDQAVTILEGMNSNYIVKVIGFTDSHGAEQLNASLSVQRANAVVSYFTSRGIDPNRVLIQSMGSKQPVAPNDTEDGRAENRRVEFKFLNPDTSNSAFVASADDSVPAPKTEDPAKTPEITPEAAAEDIAPPSSPVKHSKSPETEDSGETLAPPVTNQEKKAEFAQEQKDTMLASEKRIRNVYYKQHIYEDRKQKEDGQPYIEVMPMWLTMNHAKQLGAASDDIDSKISLHGEAGWSTFLEESYNTFFIAKGYGSIIRFDRDPSTLFADSQKEFTFGGEMGFGKYFHPDLYFQVQAGYGKELVYKNVGAGLQTDADYVFHAGLSGEFVTWRFSQKGDLGLNANFNYYDIGRGVIDSGSNYGFDIFADYDFFRGGFSLNVLNLNTQSVDFRTLQFGPTLRLYF